jgi:hypothetical protein
MASIIIPDFQVLNARFSGFVCGYVHKVNTFSALGYLKTRFRVDLDVVLIEPLIAILGLLRLIMADLPSLDISAFHKH